MSGSFRNTGSTLSNLLAGFCEVPPHLDRHISDITIDSREAMQGVAFCFEWFDKKGFGFYK